MSTRTRVAIVDDHRVFSDAIASRLGTEPDLVVVGTARDSAATWALFRDQPVDLVVLDLYLQQEDGLELARDLLASWPALQVVLVTGMDADHRGLEALRSGVRGWVSKTGSAESLVEAIRAVADGQTRVPGRLLTTVCASLPAWGTREADDDNAIRRLSERELDVLRCLVDGLSRKEIALRLGIAANTVRSHVQSILHKFEVHSTLTAVAVARRAGVEGTPRSVGP
ncbi:response regulator [Nocardioides sp. Root151]|uniref:response regulator n=1 Tax=Nocardioides sp. Root151 TaxID=1736475 RepID=UPI000702BB5F|nr:response regulator transcription factor [Nocardioides sp. Root151]KQZ67577.1 hypothetical protein ASD66_21895 [Nocardioides sp. Root151]